jgi:NADH-quinone oxidoreductase subunit M
MPILSGLIWLPILAGFLLLLLRETGKQNLARFLALLASIASIVLSLLAFKAFKTDTFDMQLLETHAWIPSLKIYYRLGIDGFSLPFILLSCFMTFIVILASYRSVAEKVPSYLAAFLILQGLMCGVFAALDAILFYTFWEAMLVPMFLIIGIWGGKNRIYATTKFFLYTFLGSVLLLVAIIYLQKIAQETLGRESIALFDILSYQSLPISLSQQKWLFLAFLIAFAIKVPMWPVHTWLPDAHVEAPTGGSVILAAILLKMGGYGFLRFILPITPEASFFFADGIIALSLMAIIYVALVALMQEDMKKLIAYSSISHMGIVTLGFFALFGIMQNTTDMNTAVLTLEGAVVQMISHGFISAGLFLCVGVLYDRLHTHLIKDYGGVANKMPVFAVFFLLFALGNIGMPGTSGFVGEFFVLLGIFTANIWYAMLAATLLVLGASYTLWMYKRVMFGKVSHPAVAALVDLQGMEKWIMLLLVIFILGLGLYPKILLNMIEPSATHLVQQLLKTKIGQIS